MYSKKLQVTVTTFIVEIKTTVNRRNGKIQNKASLTFDYIMS